MYSGSATERRPRRLRRSAEIMHKGHQSGMIGLLTQMMRLPLDTFVLSLEMMARTMRSFQLLARAGADRITAAEATPSPGDVDGTDPDMLATTRYAGDRGASAGAIPF